MVFLEAIQSFLFNFRNLLTPRHAYHINIITTDLFPLSVNLWSIATVDWTLQNFIDFFHVIIRRLPDFSVSIRSFTTKSLSLGIRRFPWRSILPIRYLHLRWLLVHLIINPGFFSRLSRDPGFGAVLRNLFSGKCLSC